MITNSISNTRNKMARRKNRVENGIRAFDMGASPHSKGEVVSGSWFVCQFRKMVSIRISGGSIAGMMRYILVIVNEIIEG